MLLRDNIFGSIEEDAQRRDFTINSLYYSVADFTVRDYVGGMKDLKDGVIRLIGNRKRATVKIRYVCSARFVLPPNWACASARNRRADPTPGNLTERYPTGTSV